MRFCTPPAHFLHTERAQNRKIRYQTAVVRLMPDQSTEKHVTSPFPDTYPLLIGKINVDERFGLYALIEFLDK